MCYPEENAREETQEDRPGYCGSPPPHNLHLHEMGKVYIEVSLAAILAQVWAFRDAALGSIDALTQRLARRALFNLEIVFLGF